MTAVMEAVMKAVQRYLVQQAVQATPLAYNSESQTENELKWRILSETQ
jgi:hypothetical protein